MIGLVDGNNFFVSCERVFDRSLVGKAVAVLSNNDGCCVALSNEMKALGIKRGTPYFQLRDREARGEIVFRSSNYELYGDLSRRIIEILREEATEVEQYSIDEAFIYPPERGGKDAAARREELLGYGRALRRKILRWTGIPCGVGFAATKTLAKIANHLAKKTPGGVYVLAEDIAAVLATLPASEVWGVGRRLEVKLRANRIVTALALRDAPDDILKAIGGVPLQRTALELRGVSACDDRDYDADPDSVTCSRSFGTPVTTLEALGETIASFLAQGAVKLRRHRRLAAGCNIYAQFAGAGTDGDFLGRTVMFPAATDATNEMLSAVRDEVAALWRPGAAYRKSGIVFFGLESADAPKQGELFADDAPRAASGNRRLYSAIDALNARYGSGRVFAAAEGIKQSWRMKRGKLSKRATTNWNELMTVR